MRGYAHTAVSLALALGYASLANAEASFELSIADPPGTGFFDPTPVAPVGGNTGATLGEQRTLALEHALALWGATLDSDVPIVVEAQFEALGCIGGAATLALGGAAGVALGTARDGGNPSFYYTRALADRLAGRDLRPGEPDLYISFNSAVDTPECFGARGFYYGLDARYGLDTDYVNVALHELGHGLGFQHLVDRSTGQLLGDRPNSFAAQLLDRGYQRSWNQLTNAERLSSFTRVRGVVWSGPEVTAEARELLELGTPLLQVSPAVSGLRAIVSDASFGATAAPLSVSAPLVAGNPIDGCRPPVNSVAGRIVLLRPACTYRLVAETLQNAGAAGVLMALSDGDLLPPRSLDELPGSTPQLEIPVFTIGLADASLLESALGSGARTAFMSRAAQERIGADPQGRVFMYATEPSTAGAIAHFDPLARPNLLMEPFEQPHDSHGLDLTAAFMRDLGWQRFCGNGRVDQAEQCDDAGSNSDSEPDACRSDCTEPRCGDGVTDSAEDCDDAEQNSDSEPDACRSDCTAARCGDGVTDSAESCDDAEDNSDSEPDACRSDCTAARCGDGVTDSAEECDAAQDNSDSEPDACRSDCTSARCGDGVIDSGEECDAAQDNSDSEPDACRSDCTSARCGDGVVDDGEECDRGDRNSDSEANACRLDCRSARCGDGVVDSGELCDTHGDCPEDCGRSAVPDAGSQAGDGGHSGGGGGGSGGESGSGGASGAGTGAAGEDGGVDGRLRGETVRCSCRVGGGRRTPSAAGGLLLASLLPLLVVRRGRAARRRDTARR